MKKVLLFALVGVMMLAFTQCGGSKGSKEFQDNKEMVTNLEKAIKEAKTCEELQGAVWSVALSALAKADTEYAENEKMTESEEQALEKLSKEVEDLMTKKSEELGCKDDDMFGLSDDVEEFGDELEENIEENIEDVEEYVEEMVEE